MHCWKRLHTLDDKHTHTGRWLLCSGDTDAGRRNAAPMGRLLHSGEKLPWAANPSGIMALSGSAPNFQLPPPSLIPQQLFGGGGENNAVAATFCFELKVGGIITSQCSGPAGVDSSRGKRREMRKFLNTQTNLKQTNSEKHS